MIDIKVKEQQLRTREVSVLRKKGSGQGSILTRCCLNVPRLISMQEERKEREKGREREKTEFKHQ